MLLLYPAVKMLWTLLLTSLTSQLMAMHGSRMKPSNDTAVCGKNISMQRVSTKQSSNYTDPESISFNSERATDQKRSTCAHTRDGDTHFWTVDLKNVYNISCVCIYNIRSSTKGINLTNNMIVIGNQSITIESFETEQNNCFHVHEGELARNITVRSSLQHLILCEVTIYGKESPFVLITQLKTWEHALYYCRDHHMDLASILNEQDQAWAVAHATEAQTDHVWLGLRFTCTLGFWFWIQSYKLGYNNFADKEKKEGCDMSVAMDKADGKWYTKSDSETHNFICTK